MALCTVAGFLFFDLVCTNNSDSILLQGSKDALEVSHTGILNIEMLQWKTRFGQKCQTFGRQVLHMAKAQSLELRRAIGVVFPHQEITQAFAPNVGGTHVKVCERLDEK